ncbi:hypothetical protein RJT34_04471 [Clitoria ternatea]|uniref:Glutaredoxin domain-containing protein n=1 Tax=Clitoria ternatea TaxID=43366 RepID=A0AAN9Q298_CLITE
MHQEIPVGTGHQPPAATAGAGGRGEAANGEESSDVMKMVTENAVMVIGTRGCCMCHVVQRLLQSLGVNPTVYEVDEVDEANVAAEVSQKIGDDGAGTVQFPTVFVGGKLFGGLEKVMATHIAGDLVPILKDVGALWL